MTTITSDNCISGLERGGVAPPPFQHYSALSLLPSVIYFTLNIPPLEMDLPGDCAVWNAGDICGCSSRIPQDSGWGEEPYPITSCRTFACSSYDSVARVPVPVMVGYTVEARSFFA